MNAASDGRPRSLRERSGDLGWVRRLVLLETVSSTNDELRRLSAADAPAGTVVIAEQQTAGRGRRERSWVSPRGLGLYLSVLFRPSGLTRDATRWTLAGAVAACEACRSIGAAEAEIKWPNDLLAGGRKLGGVLAEMRTQGSQPTELILGLGINVAQRREDFPADLQGGAVSLAEILGRPVDREDLAALVLEQLGNLAELLERGDWATVSRRWTELSPGGNGARVRVTRPTREGADAVVQGTTRGVDERGALRVLLDDGTLETVGLVESVELLES